MCSTDEHSLKSAVPLPPKLRKEKETLKNLEENPYLNTTRAPNSSMSQNHTKAQYSPLSDSISSDVEVSSPFKKKKQKLRIDLALIAMETKNKGGLKKQREVSQVADESPIKKKLI